MGIRFMVLQKMPWIRIALLDFRDLDTYWQRGIRVFNHGSRWHHAFHIELHASRFGIAVSGY